MSVKGAEDVLIAIAKQLVANRVNIKKSSAEDADQEATRAARMASEEKTWYQHLATKLFDYETDAEEKARNLRDKFKNANSEFQSVGQILKDLAGRSFGSRVRYIRKGE